MKCIPCSFIPAGSLIFVLNSQKLAWVIDLNLAVQCSIVIIGTDLFTMGAQRINTIPESFSAVSITPIGEGNVLHSTGITRYLWATQRLWQLSRKAASHKVTILSGAVHHAVYVLYRYSDQCYSWYSDQHYSCMTNDQQGSNTLRLFLLRPGYKILLALLFFYALKVFKS